MTFSCMGVTQRGYVLACTDLDEQPRAGFLPYADPWGHTTARSWLYDVSLPEHTVVIAATTQLDPADLPLHYGERYEVIAKTAGGYKIRYALGSFMLDATVPRHAVTYESAPQPEPEPTPPTEENKTAVSPDSATPTPPTPEAQQSPEKTAPDAAPKTTPPAPPENTAAAETAPKPDATQPTPETAPKPDAAKPAAEAAPKPDVAKPAAETVPPTPPPPGPEAKVPPADNPDAKPAAVAKPQLRLRSARIRSSLEIAELVQPPPGQPGQPKLVFDHLKAKDGALVVLEVDVLDLGKKPVVFSPIEAKIGEHDLKARFVGTRTDISMAPDAPEKAAKGKPFPVGWGDHSEFSDGIATVSIVSPSPDKQPQTGRPQVRLSARVREQRLRGIIRYVWPPEKDRGMLLFAFEGPAKPDETLSLRMGNTKLEEKLR